MPNRFSYVAFSGPFKTYLSSMDGDEPDACPDAASFRLAVSGAAQGHIAIVKSFLQMYPNKVRIPEMRSFRCFF